MSPWWTLWNIPSSDANSSKSAHTDGAKILVEDEYKTLTSVLMHTSEPTPEVAWVGALEAVKNRRFYKIRHSTLCLDGCFSPYPAAVVFVRGAHTEKEEKDTHPKQMEASSDTQRTP